MKRGLFGGTFDPPHEAHLALARAARDQLELDCLELVPSARPPHRHAPTAAAIDRYAMIVLACQDEPKLLPSPREILRGGVSYTIDTLHEMVEEAPGDEIFLVIGADSYDDLPAWRESREIQEIAHLVVAPRPGSEGLLEPRPEDASRLRRAGERLPREGKAIVALDMPELPYAASELRRALSEGLSEIPGLSPALHLYIRRRGLYVQGRDRGGRT